MDGRPPEPAVGRWYWLGRRLPDGSARHAAWYWCDECRQWEGEPEVVLSADAVAAAGWTILAATEPPMLP